MAFVGLLWWLLHLAGSFGGWSGSCEAMMLEFSISGLGCSGLHVRQHVYPVWPDSATVLAALGHAAL